MALVSLPAALWLYVQWTLETHGWKLLGGALLFYAARGRLRKLMARRHQQRALAEANGTSYHRFSGVSFCTFELAHDDLLPARCIAAQCV